MLSYHTMTWQYQPGLHWNFCYAGMGAYAMILTSLPSALARIYLANFAARSSIDPYGGTVAVITLIPFMDKASLIPYQYWMAGRNEPAMRISSKPINPCASTIVCFGVSETRCQWIFVESKVLSRTLTIVGPYERIFVLDQFPKIPEARITRATMPLRTALRWMRTEAPPPATNT